MNYQQILIFSFLLVCIQGVADPLTAISLLTQAPCLITLSQTFYKFTFVNNINWEYQNLHSDTTQYSFGTLDCFNAKDQVYEACGIWWTQASGVFLSYNPGVGSEITYVYAGAPTSATTSITFGYSLGCAGSNSVTFTIASSCANSNIDNAVPSNQITNCDIQNGNTCQQCANFYYLNNNQCFANNINNCISQTSATLCQTCNSSYMLSSDQTQCFIQIANCQSQANAICNQCQSGYTLFANGQFCFVPIPNCASTYTPSSILQYLVCSSCQSGYLLSYNQCTAEETSGLTYAQNVRNNVRNNDDNNSKWWNNWLPW